jgi:lipopolysaccharide export system protein LptC
VRLSATRLFPLLLMLALALLTLWLEHATRPQSEHPSLRRHDPDYIVSNFTITTYDQGGGKESTLSAKTMIHYPDDDTTELIAPRLVQTRPNEPRFTVTAERGALSSDGEEVFLYDNVRLVREASADRPEAHMSTSFLHVVRDRSLVRTDRHVSITEGGRSLAGRGMEYHNDVRQLYLRDEVRGRFERRKAP